MSWLIWFTIKWREQRSYLLWLPLLHELVLSMPWLLLFWNKDMGIRIMISMGLHSLSCITNVSRFLPGCQPWPWGCAMSYSVRAWMMVGSFFEPSKNSSKVSLSSRFCRRKVKYCKIFTDTHSYKRKINKTERVLNYYDHDTFSQSFTTYPPFSVAFVIQTFCNYNTNHSPLMNYWVYVYLIHNVKYFVYSLLGGILFFWEVYHASLHQITHTT